MKHQIDDEMRLTILAALEAGSITSEEALQRLTPQKRGRGAPKKPKSTIKVYSVITDQEAGVEKLIESPMLDIGTETHRQIGARYLELRKQYSGRVSLSKLQREILKEDASADHSEKYILACRRKYRIWTRFGHLLSKP